LHRGILGRSIVLRVTVYLKSGAAASFEAEAVLEAAGEGQAHPKFRLEFAPPERGGRRLVYLDRDDVSAVVVEEAGGDEPATPVAEAAALVAEAIGAQGVEGVEGTEGGDVLAVTLANAQEEEPGGPPRAP
jgi:hypothetical protein